MDCAPISYGRNCASMSYGGNCACMSYGGDCRLCLYVLWGKLEIAPVCLMGETVLVCMSYGGNCVFLSFGGNCASMSYGEIVLVCIMGKIMLVCMSYGGNWRILCRTSHTEDEYSSGSSKIYVGTLSSGLTWLKDIGKLRGSFEHSK